jgi:hypothetical protein
MINRPVGGFFVLGRGGDDWSFTWEAIPAYINENKALTQRAAFKTGTFRKHSFYKSDKCCLSQRRRVRRVKP